MPQINCCVGKWSACSRIEYQNPKREGQAGLTFGNVRTEELIGNVKGPLFLLGAELADIRFGHETRGSGRTLELEYRREADAGNKKAAAGGI